MELVIKVHEKDLESLKNGNVTYALLDAIKNGTPLLKGHGDLIERNKLYNDLVDLENLALNRVNHTPSTIKNNPNPAYVRYNAQLNERTRLKHKVFDAPTIIEADKEENA